MDRHQATEVLCDSDDETHWAQWLWPGGGIDFEQGYFVFERAVESEGGEWDTVWASRCSQGYSCYNGVDHVTLRRSEVEMRFNDRGKKHLGCGDTTVEFDISESEFARLVDVMKLIFAGFNQLTISA
jgi:hypothetical protein